LHFKILKFSLQTRRRAKLWQLIALVSSNSTILQKLSRRMADAAFTAMNLSSMRWRVLKEIWLFGLDKYFKSLRLTGNLNVKYLSTMLHTLLQSNRQLRISFLSSSSNIFNIIWVRI